MLGDLWRTIGRQRRLRVVDVGIHVTVFLAKSFSQNRKSYVGRIFANTTDTGMTFSAVIYVAIRVDLASRRMQTAMVVFEV